GYVVIAGNVIRIHGPVKEAFERVKDELRQKLGLGLTDLREQRGPGNFHEVLTEALTSPLGGNKEPDAQQKVIDHAARFFEQTWIRRPRRSLEGKSPVTAVGLPGLRRKLLGVIQLMQECAVNGALASYDFNRLRRKLGLHEAGQAAAAAAPAPGVL